jgi:hypothetical protein
LPQAFELHTAGVLAKMAITTSSSISVNARTTAFVSYIEKTTVFGILGVNWVLLFSFVKTNRICR